MAETPSVQPLTCCLSAGAYRNRIAWIESLSRRTLRSHVRDDLVLHLAYALEAAADVRNLVEQERICCAFLMFDLKEDSDCIRVTITAPEAARTSADMLFGHFLAEPSAAADNAVRALALRAIDALNGPGCSAQSVRSAAPVPPSSCPRSMSKP